MKNILYPAATFLALLLAGCLSAPEQSSAKDDPVPKPEAYIVGTDIRIEDISDFYYTYDNINYMANYLRYRFFAEDGKHFFYYEKREKDDYGPTTEDDITAVGTLELSDREWASFFAFLKNGTVRKRRESDETGDSGPWTYLYWSGDRSEYQDYSFPSQSAQTAFEEYCRALAQIR